MADLGAGRLGGQAERLKARLDGIVLLDGLVVLAQEAQCVGLCPQCPRGALGRAVRLLARQPGGGGLQAEARVAPIEAVDLGGRRGPILGGRGLGDHATVILAVLARSNDGTVIDQASAWTCS